jgi:hypothetical protein
MNPMRRNVPWLLLSLALAGSAAAVALQPKDFARQWQVLAPCPQAPAAGTSACEGAFAVTLDESVYRQVRRADLGDIAAFNAAGEALPFGPMPAEYRAPATQWREAAWFLLPPSVLQPSEDLQLHVTRGSDGELSLDATLKHGPAGAPQDILLDVREEERTVEALIVEPAMDSPDFSVQVAVEASDDLETWRVVEDSATLAHLRQGGQALLRSRIEFAPERTDYLRLRLLDGRVGIPARVVRLLLREPGPATAVQPRARIAADFVRQEGRAYVYRLPARVPVDRVDVELGDDNAISSFSVSAREPGEKYWAYVGQLEAFRLRAAGVQLDNEPLDIGATRRLEWRIESSTELARTPVLEFSYRPERWLLLTHGAGPYVVAAGSNSRRGGEFPLSALLGQVRGKFGRDWQPAPAALGAMQTAGGDAALSAYDPESKRTWLLWAVLLVAAVVVIAMVLRLLKAAPEE